MGFFWWLFQNVFRREYPLISIPRFPRSNVPYSTFFPNKISLTFSKFTKQIWKITDDNISDIIEAILEHEYLHIIIEHKISYLATNKLNNIHRFDLTTNQLTWCFRDGKTFRD
jgi:hypothetical protein